MVHIAKWDEKRLEKAGIRTDCGSIVIKTSTVEGSLGDGGDEDGGHDATNDIAESGFFVRSVVDCEFWGRVKARFEGLEKGVEIALLEKT